VNAHILSLFESGKRFTVYTNASGIGLGCVLVQHGKAVAYGSRQLKKHERTILPMTKSWLLWCLP
jgi:hypothetical protein